ncbi:hypothetical protein S225a_13420 [Candidatus Brocadiaceae bacterium S225]|uniref:Uncharacterized protein n=1 Tax=Candidatus Scalindua brodae TaxID=237368 RepID=A0A0B0EE47_9BACT|nr:MAG: hypothetical protein SCABRO_02859 [Candidatus Scalindua brodae]TWU34084.1 hypothetical protein S225a_13420 [Candidatus Brocadiaceae bacterium S225]
MNYSSRSLYLCEAFIPFREDIKGGKWNVVEGNDMYELNVPIAPYNAHIDTEKAILKEKNVINSVG